MRLDRRFAAVILQVECALFRLLTLERMLGPKLVWSQLEEAAASGGIIDEENIARYAAAVSSSFKQVSSARLAELPVFAVQVRLFSHVACGLQHCC